MFFISESRRTLHFDFPAPLFLCAGVGGGRAGRTFTAVSMVRPIQTVIGESARRGGRSAASPGGPFGLTLMAEVILQNINALLQEPSEHGRRSPQ